MRKIISFILICATVLSTLVGCSQNAGNADVTTTAQDVQTEAPVNNIDIDLTGYTIIRSENVSAAMIVSLFDFKSAIEGKCGIRLGYTDDFIPRGETEAADAKEIVVGLTTRTASKTTASSLEGSGYTIRLIGQRIIILGSDESKTLAAMNYFVENYIMAANASVLTVPENFCYNSEFVPSFDVIKDNTTDYTVIYSDDLDDKGSATSDSDKIDAEVDWSSQIITAVNKLAGTTVLRMDTDWVKKGSTPNPETPEILVGFTNRPEFDSVKESLAIDEYTVRVVGKKIVIFGWSLKTQKLAVEHFLSMFNAAAIKGDDGKVNFSVASDYCYTGKTDSGWLLDVPQYEGGTLSGSYDANNGSMTVLYENTNVSEYDAYGSKLLSAGYTLHMENTIADNVFRTYLKDSNLIHTYYVGSYNRVKITTNSNNKRTPSALEPDNDFIKVCDMTMTQMILDYPTGTFGMCYIITLEDGSYLIYDGGGSTGGSADHTRLYNILRTHNKRTDNRIIIAAWIITHPHGDHWAVFRDFINSYSPGVEIENVIMNAPNMLELHNALGVTNAGDNQIPTLIARTGANFIIPYTGQYFYVRNLKIEVLYTHEASYPYNLDDLNNTSMVTRFTIAGQKILMLGDLQLVGSKTLIEMYGKEIKSDIVQMAHHGSDGVTLEAYNLMDPEVLLWPCSQSSFDYKTTKNYNNGQKNGYYFTINYALVNSKTIKEHLVADGTNKTLTFPYVPGNCIEFK